jgi:hypothetical protein
MSDENRLLALMAGIAILAGPRRTRPVAGFLYGVFVSRAQGAGLRRLEGELLRLFDERNGAHRRIDPLERRMNRRRVMERALMRRVDVLEAQKEATDGDD